MTYMAIDMLEGVFCVLSLVAIAEIDILARQDNSVTVAARDASESVVIVSALC